MRSELPRASVSGRGFRPDPARVTRVPGELRETLDVALSLDSHRVARREVADQAFDPIADLQREMGRRGPGEGPDFLDRDPMPGRQAIRPALHRPATYFYPYGAANPDVGSVEEIKAQMEKLRVQYLIIDPMDGYAEGKATLRLFGQIVASYGAKARLVFRSTDGKHRIYALESK